MQQISMFIQSPIIVKDTIKSERAYVVSLFLEELNKERLGTLWKPLTGRSVAIILSPIKTTQGLYEFLSECRDYKKRNGSFGKRFFGGCKIKVGG